MPTDKKLIHILINAETEHPHMHAVTVYTLIMMVLNTDDKKRK
jgi:hypothetical protein